MSFDPTSISALANMLQECSGENNSDSDGEDYKPKSGFGGMGPGDVGPKKAAKPKESKSAYKAKPVTKDIWEEDEVPTGSEYDDIHDPRPQPDYDITYQQAISTEDMYLQMGNKTPATSSCEIMVVKVTLPKTKLADVELDCKDKFVDCRTPKYKLGLHLPHTVDSKNAKAQWDGNSETLKLTLRMKRDYDFMNF